MRFSWETMSSTRNLNDLSETEICNKTFLKGPQIPSLTETKPDSITRPPFESVGDAKENPVICDIDEYSVTTSKNFSSSADSGVNISDNDETPPPSFPPANPNSLSPSTILSNKINSAESPGNQKYDSDGVNNCEVIRGNTSYMFNTEDGNRNGDIKSENPKINFINNSGNEEDTNQFQLKQNHNDGKNVLREETPTYTSKENTNKTPSFRNDINNVQQGRASISTSMPTSSVAISYDDNTTSEAHQYNGSPNISIRSINSIIITSDSESDSDSENDSDVNSDIVDSHEDYVIKKLGTQVTYSPNDPNTPNINRGHTVLNQKVITSDSEVPPSPLETLAAIGDSIGAAQALGTTPPFLTPAQRPQIGSIALNNSSDVTFGDKHFYEGPVTIQQFLINGRDKRKEANGVDNPAFANENAETFTNNAKDIISPTGKPNKVFEYVLKRKKLIVPGVLAITALLITATVLGSKAFNDGKNANNNNNYVDENQECECNGTLCLIGRDVWGALEQKRSLEKQLLPLHRVIISHTASEPCDSLTVCAEYVRVIQKFHMDSLDWNDIGYNFLISSDGRVYVGRGWDFVGSHTKGYNYDSVGISFIGTYISTSPTEVQLRACLTLLAEGLRLKKLAPDYRLYGARQLGSTESPGDMLYKKIKKWPHWSPNINLT